MTIDKQDFVENREFLHGILSQHQVAFEKDLFKITDVLSFAYYEDSIQVGGYLAKRTDDLVHLELLAVDPIFRGKDIGGKLMDHLIKKSIEIGCTRITLTTLSFQAKDFYMKFGFSVFGELSNTPIKDVTKIYMTRILSGENLTLVK